MMSTCFGQALTQPELTSLAGDIPPIASFIANPPGRTSPLLVDFDATGSFDPDGGPIVNYAWDFGDGTGDTGPTPQKSFNADGSFVVTLTITDDEGSMATSERTVVVGELADEILVFDWDRVVTQSHRGIPQDRPPMASANGDWTQPPRFDNGTFYIRLEILSQPVPQLMNPQFCVWQITLGLESYTTSNLLRITGNPGTVITKSQPIDSMWKKNGDPINWAVPRERCGVAIKNPAGLPVSNFQGWNWNGEDPTEWYPLDMHFTFVVVQDGGSFSGWENYVTP